MLKNIIHIALGKINPDRPNGVNKVVNSLISYQVKNNFDAEFWGISFSKTHNYPERNYRTRLFLDSKNKFRLDNKLKAAINDLNPKTTIFHLHGAFTPQLYMVARLLKKNNLEYVLTPHGGYNLVALQKSRFTKLIYINLFEKYLVRNAKMVQLIGQSETIGTDKYFKNNHIIIPNGQILNKKSSLSSKKHKLTIGFIGRIDIHTKGLDLLLIGLKKVIKKLEIKLQIIGSKGEMKELLQLVENNELQDNVEFMGAQYGRDKLELMSKWDALCLTSRNEGLPGVVLEAASIGIPCIISNETNMGSYVNQYESGWVLEKNTPQNIAQAILNVLDAKKYCRHKKFGDAAYKMIQKEFEWGIIVKQLSEVYA